MPVSIVIFLQISFIINIFIHGEDFFDCTGHEDDSFHPVYDAEDCRRYWHCIYVDTVYMHAVKRVCPAGTEFDSALRKCETSALVDCVPVRSPVGSKIKTTTKAWRWKYSKLFSQKYLKTTVPYSLTTRPRRIFDVGEDVEDDTTAIIMQDSETTEPIQVLPFVRRITPSPTVFSLEKLSKDLNALLLNRQPLKNKLSKAKLFQPGEPENEAIVYESTSTTTAVTVKQRSRRTRSTTKSTPIELTTALPLTTFSTTTETTTIAMITTDTTTPITTTTTTTSSSTFPITSTYEATLTTQTMTSMNVFPKPRINNSRSRRNNMTLYILTSDEHKIRRFTINHTRGFLLNCNQLRNRLLNRRRLRDTLHMTSTYSSMVRYYYHSFSSRETCHYNIFSLIMLSLFFLQKYL